MAIREAARDAWVSSRSDKEDEAREFLGGVLTPFTVDLLETVDVQVEDTFTLFVLHDAEDDVHIAARYRDGGWEAFVVTPGDGWTIASVAITSLAHLHTLLPEVEDPEPAPSYPEWSSTGRYQMGARALFGGDVWEVTAVGGDGFNVWSPGPSGYGWQKVAI